jgi:hypothetical protein
MRQMASPTAWRNRIVGSELVPPTDLLANPNNAVAIERWERFTGKTAERLDG